MYDFDFGFSPFPGMNPYVESVVNWSDFHSTFIHALREAINTQLPKPYYARVHELVMMLGPDSTGPKVSEPDVFVGRGPGRTGSPNVSSAGAATLEPLTLAHIERLDPHRELTIDIIRLPEQNVVTVVELFSPTNKYGDGRAEYSKKRRLLPQTPANIVELDLLRRGRRMPLSKPLPPDDYYAFISRGDRRPMCDVYHWSVRDLMPVLPVPLRPPDADLLIGLAEPFKVAFSRGLYGRFVDYSQAPPPPAMLSEDLAWMARLLNDAASARRE
jgi:hypothetical protein